MVGNGPAQWKYKPFLTFGYNEVPWAIGKLLIHDYVAWMIVKVRVRTGHMEFKYFIFQPGKSRKNIVHCRCQSKDKIKKDKLSLQMVYILADSSGCECWNELCQKIL